MHDDTINADVTMGDATTTLLAKRYRVVRQLGQGGMGSVWLAEDTQLDNREVAIKMLPPILVSNPRAYQQLKTEALVSLKLAHPNIAAVRAFEENGGNPFLVVDFIDGETLDDYLADRGRMSEDEATRILQPIAAALDYAHGAGVVHRDVKPGNVMIAKDGSPYILDFGIAREIQETMTRVTGKLSSGTLLYMSPEQLRGAEPKAAQDVYSFAAMVYECLTGEPPFSRGQIEYQILNEVPKCLDAGIQIGASVMAGLAKEPSSRPRSCAALLVPTARSPSARISGSPAARASDSVEQVSRRCANNFKVPDLILRQSSRPSLRKVTACGLAVIVTLSVVGFGVKAVMGRRAERTARMAARAAGDRALEILEDVRKISAENGFARRISSVERAYEDGRDQFGRKKFARAQSIFDEVAATGRRVMSDDIKRRRSISLQQAAKDARKRGVGIYARQDSPRLWELAEKNFAEGIRQQSDRRFVEASMLFAKSRQDFDDAYTDASRVAKERGRTERERQVRNGEAAIAGVRREVGKLISDCRAADGVLTNRVLACEKLYNEAERMRSNGDWTRAACSYTNALTACREILAENARLQKLESERRVKGEKVAREKELAKKQEERNLRRREAELEAYRRKHYPECYGMSTLKELGTPIEYAKGQMPKRRNGVDANHNQRGELPKTGADGAARLVGRWSCRYTVTCITDGLRLPPNSPIDETFVFHSDGSLSYLYDSNNKYIGSSVKNGSWTFSGETLRTVIDGVRVDYRIIWKRKNSFELRYENLDQYIGKSKSLMPSVSSLRAKYDSSGNLVKFGKFSGFLGIGASESKWIESPKVFSRR